MNIALPGTLVGTGAPMATVPTQEQDVLRAVGVCAAVGRADQLIQPQACRSVLVGDGNADRRRAQIDDRVADGLRARVAGLVLGLDQEALRAGRAGVDRRASADAAGAADHRRGPVVVRARIVRDQARAARVDRAVRRHRDRDLRRRTDDRGRGNAVRRRRCDHDAGDQQARGRPGRRRASVARLPGRPCPERSSGLCGLRTFRPWPVGSVSRASAISAAASA